MKNVKVLRSTELLIFLWSLVEKSFDEKTIQAVICLGILCVNLLVAVASEDCYLLIHFRQAYQPFTGFLKPEIIFRLCSDTRFIN